MLYLDHAATTPLAPAVLDAMLPYLREQYGNPSSVHRLGRAARVAVERAREEVAGHLGCEPAEVVFTSGATEANNAALRGTLEALGPSAGLVTSATEHEAVLQPAEALREAGHPVALLVPSSPGALTAAQVEAALVGQQDAGAAPGLVSVMLVNNELGTIAPVAEIAEAAHACGAFVHTDAVQAATLFDLAVDALGVDLLSLSGHKLYGPKGTGALYVRAGTPCEPLVRGGAQERRRRGGTENVAAIVGFAAGLRLAVEQRDAERMRLAALQQTLAQALRDAFGDRLRFNTPLAGFAPVSAPVAPHILNVSFRPHAGTPLDGEMLLLSLDLAGVLASSGSACTSGAVEPSHVLQALGVPSPIANATLRLSLGRSTTAETIREVVARLKAIVARMGSAESRGELSM